MNSHKPYPFAIAALIWAVLVIFTVIVPSPVVADFSCGDILDIDEPECEALVALYDSTNGPAWTNSLNWLTPPSADAWYGVTVELGHVVNLNLYNNQLNGTIPSEIGLLTHLDEIYLNGNHLNGPIPPALGNIPTLRGIFLGGNQLSGELPLELFNLTNLIELSLGNNMLSGPIPADLADLAELSQIWLYNNQFSGSIPPEIGSMTQLSYLWLHKNRLTGDVPASFINLVNLKPFDYDYGAGLNLDYNFLNVPPGYPNPEDDFHVFLFSKDDDWHLYQTWFYTFLPAIMQ